MQEEAIEIAATQTKSAQADLVITGVAFPGFGIRTQLGITRHARLTSELHVCAIRQNDGALRFANAPYNLGMIWE